MRVVDSLVAGLVLDRYLDVRMSVVILAILLGG